MKRNVYTAVHTVSLRLIVLLIRCRVRYLRIVLVTIELKIMCSHLCFVVREHQTMAENCGVYRRSLNFSLPYCFLIWWQMR